MVRTKKESPTEKRGKKVNFKKFSQYLLSSLRLYCLKSLSPPSNATSFGYQDITMAFGDTSDLNNGSIVKMRG